MAWPAVNVAFKQEEFRRYVDRLTWSKWRPSRIVWHNTAAPSLAQWKKSADADGKAGKTPGISRINSLNTYFRDHQGWNGSPHLFIADDFIWVMNPLTATGTHSPSWNGIAIGIEMIGDFSKEDDDSGAGLAVKNNTIFATAILCAELGLDPTSAIYLHKQDPRTTHDCPGKDIAQDKLQMIQAVVGLMNGGEHDPAGTSGVIAGEEPKVITTSRQGTCLVDGLNFRRGPGVLNESIGSLPKGTKLVILGQASNGTTGWLRVKTPAGYEGWVAAQYIKENT